MKIKIKYYYIKSDHILATPEYDHKEIVEVANQEDLDNYIFKQKDDYGNKFKKKTSYGFDYISHQGGIKIKIYNPKIKKIS